MRLKPLAKWVVAISGALVLMLLLAAIPAAIAIKLAVGWFWSVPQNGMYPTLPAKSSFFCTYHPYRSAKDARRGDIIVFNHDEGAGRYIYIWRVVGLPGDSLEINDARVTINGQPLPQEKIRSEDALEIYRERNGEASYEVSYDPSPREGAPDVSSMTVPDEHLFVLGDNRRHASDSRIMGPIPWSSVIARRW